MSALSIVKPGCKAVPLLANPIFLTSPLRTENGAEMTFEVFDSDAAGLKEVVGTRQLYHLDGELFWADLKSLQPCQSTHPALSLLRDKPTLRGVFSLHGDDQGAPS
ncbi:MAG: hypothetical protein ACREDL_00085 [Bradyrhizobium sp.]